MSLFKTKEQFYWLAYSCTYKETEVESLTFVGYRLSRLAIYDKAKNFNRNAYGELQDIWNWLAQNKGVKAQGIFLYKKADGIYNIIENFQLIDVNGKPSWGRRDLKNSTPISMKGELPSNLEIPP
jgi:hypothetical protein